MSRPHARVKRLREGQELIVLGITATGLLVLLPRRAFGKPRAGESIIIASEKGDCPVLWRAVRETSDRRGRWARLT